MIREIGAIPNPHFAIRFEFELMIRSPLLTNASAQPASVMNVSIQKIPIAGVGATASQCNLAAVFAGN
jgi:hypothetical protein